MKLCLREQLFSGTEIRLKVQELAECIEHDACGRPIVFIVVLNGAFIFASDLIRFIRNSDIQLDTICTSAYKNEMISSEHVQLRKDIDLNLHDHYVVLIEDMIDTGRTLKYLSKYIINKYEPYCLKICTLLDKPSRRLTDLKPDYVGFTIDDLFVVGYGIDCCEKYRQLPYIAYVEKIAEDS
ncbi:unnamed protein product [Didymodactylos carnosus]|uniref:Hypoxanthine phosphoribosyltransferase n=1 Tax=Didymodactylos carnosus TaxID=1234261 RepID=A0A814HQW6_9BILA|nr:unnamed protein product [Didymodactylos carnosus]CAF1420439.1 unnamed protein product [Didymodactylos carnosus]CAF3784682.1 unnamed protein product [Didymodactylos carnosus]CAF4221313.1 unnamed protein product [Didymodactylos carnosus]